jgi:hypothetical protein
VELSRQFVSKELSGEDYGVEFLIAQNEGSRANEWLGETLSGLINDLLFDLSNHSAFDEERMPDQLDDEQLRALVAQHLTDYAAGRYGPVPDEHRG